MRAHRFLLRRGGLLLLACGPLLFACGPAPEPARPTPRQGVAPGDEEATRARRLGAEAVAKLRRALGSRLRAAIQQGGPRQAIAVCADQAQQITAAVNATLPQGVTVRRTSDRIRNPRNRPGPGERQALTRLSETHRAEPLLERRTRPDGGTVYHYYQPIRVAGVCLRCHGPPDRLAPGVGEVLRARYPQDQAVGYRPGDLRGIFSVTIPAEALRAR